MTQPPQAPQPPDAQDPRRPERADTDPTAPHSSEPDGDAAPGKGPILVIVAGGLLLLVLLLALGAYFGVRALVDDDERGEQASASQEEGLAKEYDEPGEGLAERERTEGAPALGEPS